MNHILTLCLGVLLITIPFSTQSSTGSNTTAVKPNPSVTKNSASAERLGLVHTALYLLIPAAILGFLHTRS